MVSSMCGGTLCGPPPLSPGPLGDSGGAKSCPQVPTVIRLQWNVLAGPAGTLPDPLEKEKKRAVGAGKRHLEPSLMRMEGMERGMERGSRGSRSEKG
ncbi:hypothetical protein AOLI_G00283740 [Acnodon oligacanthus]